MRSLFFAWLQAVAIASNDSFSSEVIKAVEEISVIFAKPTELLSQLHELRGYSMNFREKPFSLLLKNLIDIPELVSQIVIGGPGFLEKVNELKKLFDHGITFFLYFASDASEHLRLIAAIENLSSQYRKGLILCSLIESWEKQTNPSLVSRAFAYDVATFVLISPFQILIESAEIRLLQWPQSLADITINESIDGSTLNEALAQITSTVAIKAARRTDGSLTASLLCLDKVIKLFSEISEIFPSLNEGSGWDVYSVIIAKLRADLVHLIASVRRLAQRFERGVSCESTGDVYITCVHSEFAAERIRIGSIQDSIDDLGKKLLDSLKLYNLDHALHEFELNVSHSESESAECVICFHSIHYPGSAELKCSHVFHIHCLKDWLQRASSCPLCRGAILP